MTSQPMSSRCQCDHQKSSHVWKGVDGYNGCVSVITCEEGCDCVVFRPLDPDVAAWRAWRDMHPEALRGQLSGARLEARLQHAFLDGRASAVVVAPTEDR